MPVQPNQEPLQINTGSDHAVQATLLTVSIAIILALLAALVGPYFVDWGHYRTTFETEASRLVGMPVHITGSIDARLLPTPSVVIRGIETGDTQGERPLRAREVAIELALAPLLRGQWRAAEMHVVGPEIRLGLTADARIDWPAAGAAVDLGQLSIDRLSVEDGRAVLRDGASGGSIVLEGLTFDGVLRSLAGPAKGEGGFRLDGEHYGYRIVASRPEDEGGTKLRLGVDASDRPLTIDADGSLSLEQGVPRFEGSLTLARPAGSAPASGRGQVNVPWHLTGRVKATAGNALFEQVEYRYGPDERAIRLTGAADVKFGKSPRFDIVLSAHQVDLDAALDLPDAMRRLPLVSLQTFAETLGARKLPIPGRLGISVDSVTLAGSQLQSVRGDFDARAEGWDLETLELHAPGATQARLSGRLGFGPQGMTFKGPARIDATEPAKLIGWLEGHPETPAAQVGTLRAGGEVTLGAGRIAIDRLNAELDRRTIEGRLSYAVGDGNRARAEAELKAAQFDIDRVVEFAHTAFAGAAPPLPDELLLALDLGETMIAGVEAKNVKVKLQLDAGGLTLDRVSVADLAGASLELNGRIQDLATSPRGMLSLDLTAAHLEGALALLAKLRPQAADIVRPILPRLVPLKAHAGLGVEPSDGAGHAARTAKLAVDGTAGAMRLHLTGDALGDPADIPALALKLDGELAAADGRALVAVLGLDHALAAEGLPGSLTVAVRGPAGSDLTVNARLAAGGVSASAAGTARVTGGDGPSAALVLALSADDAGPLLQGRAAAKLPVALKGRFGASLQKLTLDGLSGTFAGAALSGHLDLGLDPAPRIEGRIETDAVDVAQLIGLLIGAPKPTGGAGAAGVAAEPFTPGLLKGVAGRVEFAAARAALTPALGARDVRGVLRLGDAEVAFEDVAGEIGGGRLAGQLSFRRLPEGIGARGRIAISDADPAVLLPGAGRGMVSGRLTLQGEAEGTGLSPATLVGSLNGSGTIVLDNGRISGINPGVFEIVIRAVDQGLAVDGGKIRDAVVPALGAGDFAVPHAEGVLTVAAGQVKLARLIAHGQGADLAIAGDLVLADQSIDTHLTLSGPADKGGPSGAGPDLFLAISGPLASPHRMIDVSPFTGWLTLRSIDRETKRMEAIETGAAPAGDAGHVPDAHPPAANAQVPEPGTAPPKKPARPQASIAPATDSAPALPPPIEIQPVPGAGGPPTPRTTRPRQPPPSAAPQNHSVLESLFGAQR